MDKQFGSHVYTLKVIGSFNKGNAKTQILWNNE